MGSNVLLQLKNVSKFYDSRLILKNINLSFYGTTCTLLTGANGSGKSTLLKLAAEILRPGKGEVIRNFPERAAYIGHETMLYPKLTAMENLLFWDGISGLGHGRKQISAALSQAGLEKWQDEKTAYFSKGMIQKIQLAKILLSDSPLILLDEPYSGLDTNSELLARDIFRQKRDKGCAIVMAVHFPEREAGFANSTLLIKHQKIETIS